MSMEIHYPKSEDDFNIIPMGGYYVNPYDNKIYRKLENGQDELQEFGEPKQEQQEPGILT